MNRTAVLPKSAYTSQEWYDREQKEIFGNTWQYAGLVEDLKEPGDSLTIQCGFQNILVVMGKDEQLRAFHNICRHRGTQLLRTEGKRQKAITCPYHDWTYNLNGQLVSVPDKKKEFPDLELGTICLHRASVAVWRGVIWVHPKPNAEYITNWFAETDQYLGPHAPLRLIEYPGSDYEKVVNANWKIIVENYIDIYHLSHLHSNTLNMYDHRKAEFRFVRDHYMFWEPLAKTYRENLSDLMPYKGIGEMKDSHVGAYVPWLFPSLGLVETESSWSVFHIEPISPEKTKIKIRTKLEKMSTMEYYRQSRRSEKYWPKLMGVSTKYDSKEKGDVFSLWDFMEEDIFACEQQQISLKNPLYEVQYLAKHGEAPVRHFQSVIKNWVKPELVSALAFSSDST